MVVVGPGDLYTSIVCNFIVGGVRDAIKKTHAKCVYIMNLMTKFGETTDFTASDHIETLEKYLGKGSLDYCLVNRSKKYPKGVLKKYKEEKAFPVKDDLKKNGLKLLRRSLVGSKVYKKSKSDKIKRSLIRHDSKKLAKAIMSLL
jgi:uncharacterized cofD-like protein